MLSGASSDISKPRRVAAVYEVNRWRITKERHSLTQALCHLSAYSQRCANPTTPHAQPSHHSQPTEQSPILPPNRLRFNPKNNFLLLSKHVLKTRLGYAYPDTQICRLNNGERFRKKEHLYVNYGQLSICLEHMAFFAVILLLFKCLHVQEKPQDLLYSHRAGIRNPISYLFPPGNLIEPAQFRPPHSRVGYSKSSSSQTAEAGPGDMYFYQSR